MDDQLKPIYHHPQPDLRYKPIRVHQRTQLLSKIAIIGYKQEVSIGGNWKPLDSSLFNGIKKQASEHFL
jgi:hypothetical protein